MPWYRFNVRHDERVFLDTESQELPGIVEAQAEALQARAEMARDQIPANTKRDLAIEVADESGRPLLVAMLILRITREG
jgi:hypothetical protein